MSNRRDGRNRREAVFSKIYHHNSWLGQESVSGPGSDIHATEVVRRALPAIVAEFGIASILDAPCGDFHWMKTVALPVERYIGVDVVPELVEANQQAYGSTSVEFRQLDICADDIPRVDLIFARDVLVHLSFVDIIAALRGFKSSGSSYLLTTTFTHIVENQDIPTGEWRPLDLTLDPFVFPEPIALIDEGVDLSHIDLTGSKCLGLWRLEQIDPQVVEHRVRDTVFSIYRPPAERRLIECIAELHTYFATGDVILVDDEALVGLWGVDPPRVRRLTGEYREYPADDAAAVRRLEMLRRQGATHIAFVFVSFWWFDHYRGLAVHLRQRFEAVTENERVLVFDLRQGHRQGGIGSRDA